MSHTPLAKELADAASKLGIALAQRERPDAPLTPLNGLANAPAPPDARDIIAAETHLLAWTAQNNTHTPQRHQSNLDAFELLAARAAAADTAERTNQELADSLAKSFERADVTMAVAAAQRSVHSPDRFVLTVCEEVRSTIGFDWTGILFDRNATAPASLAKSTLFATDGHWTPELAEQAALSLAHDVDPRNGPWVNTFELPEGAARGCGILQTFAIEHQTAGMLVGGWADHDTRSLNSYHLSLAESVCAFIGPFMENLLLHERDRGRFFATLEALSSTLDAKDPYTRGHSERVALLARRTGAQLHMTERELEHLEIAGRLHDVGKIGVPESVLLKPGKLTDEEFDQIKRHPAIGYEILKGVPGLEHMLPGVLHHHERWDGRGYPDGLEGKEIPFQARILAVADTFDAMSSKRSYRDAVDRDIVFKVIRENRGSQFDPAVADAFLSLDLSWYADALNKTIRSTTPSDRRAA